MHPVHEGNRREKCPYKCFIINSIDGQLRGRESLARNSRLHDSGTSLASISAPENSMYAHQTSLASAFFESILMLSYRTTARGIRLCSEISAVQISARINS
jgi:hypothetical protein